MTDATAIDDLIVRVLEGVAGNREQSQLEEWRRAKPENERTFQEFARVWELGEARTLAAIVSSPPPLERITTEAERRRTRVIPLLRPRRPKSLRFTWAAAAIIAIAVAVGVAKMIEGPSLLLSTGPTETTTTQLADGSIVRLGPDSRAEVSGSDQRMVRLEGSAFFAVATDSATPFTVQTEVGIAEVKGTRFEVRANADSLRLVVVEGIVNLSASGSDVAVDHGAVSRIVAGLAPSPPQHVDVWQLLEWPGGLMIYQATPLDEVVQEVSSFFNRTIVLRNARLSETRVTAWFQDQSFEEVVTTLCAVLGVDCSVGDVAEVGT
jgi:ferric-dicitrate binding protein FerR (iron transport regulator)